MVEHPFGSIKQWMNQGAFLMKGQQLAPEKIEREKCGRYGGTRIKAVNNKDRNFTKNSLEKRSV